MTTIEAFGQFRPFSVGFDSIFEKLSEASIPHSVNYPPYNIVKRGDNQWFIELAVAGFSKKDIDIELKENKLFQSCHILHKQGRYFIVHFKELFMLDGKKSNLEQSDIERRNTIATLLSDWGLVEIQNTEQAKECSSLKQIKIIPFKEKNDWELCPKYNIGNK